MRRLLTTILIAGAMTAAARQQAAPAKAAAPPTVPNVQQTQTAAPPPGTNPSPQAGPAQAGAAPGVPQFVFHANSRLVIETVTVTDHSGKSIPGLKASDFTVTEDGIPQSIAVFDYQRMTDAAPAPAPAAATAAPAPVSKPVAPVAGSGITPETAGNNRYKDHRLIVLYFDLTAMQPADSLRAMDDAKSYVQKKLLPSDLVAIMTYEGGAVKVKQDFTADKDQLESTIDAMSLVVLGYDEDSTDAASSDTGSAFGQDDSEFNIFTTNRQMAALQTAVNMLSTQSEKKSLVYFSSGLNLNGLDNQAQLQATENAAVRAGVSFFPVDARGLIAAPPMGDATQGSPGGISMYNGAGIQAGLTRILSSQNTLYSLAADTGGKALFDSNDLGEAIHNAEAAITDYYIIGYYTTNPALDGKYRRVKITYNGDASAKLAYRVGYYTGKMFAKFTEADKERQLEDALMLGDPITDLTIDLELNWFELDSAEYFVPISARIPGKELVLAKAGGAERSEIDFIGEVKDEYGTTITNLRDKIDMKLSDTTAAQLAQVPIEFNAGVTLLPGKYSIKLLARDDETGRIGTYLASLTIPNLVKVTDQLPISTVVLGSQRTPLADALYNVKKDVSKDAAETDNPLVEDGEQLLPSVTRVFSQKNPLYLYLQAYERPLTEIQPLVFYASFYRRGVKVFETKPVTVNSGLEPHSYAVPLSLTIPLQQLAPGMYTCQVTVLDPSGSKAAFWQGDMEVVP